VLTRRARWRRLWPRSAPILAAYATLQACILPVYLITGGHDVEITGEPTTPELILLTIIGLGFLLLVVAFRSLLIPATTAVLNLLAAAASFGVLTAFFQWGWGTDAFGLGTAGPVEAFLPSTSPSGFGRNDYYASEQDYLAAVAEAMRQEYLAIVESGFLLQVDDPWLIEILTDDGHSDPAERRSVWSPALSSPMTTHSTAPPPSSAPTLTPC